MWRSPRWDRLLNCPSRFRWMGFVKVHSHWLKGKKDIGLFTTVDGYRSKENSNSLRAFTVFASSIYFNKWAVHFSLLIAFGMFFYEWSKPSYLIRGQKIHLENKPLAVKGGKRLATQARIQGRWNGWIFTPPFSEPPLTEPSITFWAVKIVEDISG